MLLFYSSDSDKFHDDDEVFFLSTCNRLGKVWDSLVLNIYKPQLKWRIYIILNLIYFNWSTYSLSFSIGSGKIFDEEEGGVSNKN